MDFAVFSDFLVSFFLSELEHPTRDSRHTPSNNEYASFFINISPLIYFIISYKTNKKSHSEEQLNSRNRMKSHNHPEYIIT